MIRSSRIYLIFVVILSLALTALAQNPIPNPGFEDWTDGNPDGWFTNNIFGVATFITQSNTSHTGSYAVQGEVATYLDVAAPPFITTSAVEYLPISQNYASLTGYYQFTTLGSDSFYVAVLLFDAQFGIVAAGAKVLGTTNSSYTKFTADLEYLPINMEPAAFAFIEFIIMSDSETFDPSSTFLLDDLEFSGVTAIAPELGSNVPDKFSLYQNFPNPFNPSTNINFSIPEAEYVTLEVFNALGQKVETLLNKNMPAGLHRVTFDSKELAGGIYFYKIQAGNYSEIKKMILVK